MSLNQKQTLWKTYIPEAWSSLKHYSWKFFRKDLIAGVTVGIVALPLAMAFAIASGVGPEKGLYTAIVAGFLISLLGGSKVQIGGPTGAFVVIVYEVIQRRGYDGLVLATLIAAIFLILMGAFRLGTWIKFIPYPLVIGFTSGIAVIIFFSQLKDLLGLHLESIPASFIKQTSAYVQALPTFDPATCTMGLGTLGLIIAIRRFIPMIPWGISAIVIATLITSFWQLPIDTIATRFGAIPRILPKPGLPEFALKLSDLHELIPDAMVIAFLAGIESLLSAIVADGMIGGRHKSNCELVAQGFANLGSMFFSGLPATGAIARTATNIKTGAQTPIAGMLHAVTLFLIILAFAPLVSRIPLAALAAVLVMVAWNMSEIVHFHHLLKAPLGDVAILLMTFFLTVLVDLTVAVQVGLILAAFLFMKRMSDLSNKISLTPFLEEKEEEDPDAISKKNVPLHVEVYEINGPFFFGVADSLKDLLHNLEKPPKVFILRLRKVPVIDATGLHALKEFYHRCQKDYTELILSGVQGQPKASMQKYGLETLIGPENFTLNIDQALKRARELIKS